MMALDVPLLAGQGIGVTITRSDKPDSKERFVLVPGKTVIKIGRSPGCQVPCTSVPGISVHHAELWVAPPPEQGATPMQVRDLSTNGTGIQLNEGKKTWLAKGVDVPLPNGATLVIPMNTKRREGENKPECKRIWITIRLNDDVQAFKLQDTPAEAAQVVLQDVPPMPKAASTVSVDEKATKGGPEPDVLGLNPGKVLDLLRAHAAQQPRSLSEPIKRSAMETARASMHKHDGTVVLAQEPSKKMGKKEKDKHRPRRKQAAKEDAEAAAVESERAAAAAAAAATEAVDHDIPAPAEDSLSAQATVVEAKKRKKQKKPFASMPAEGLPEDVTKSRTQSVTTSPAASKPKQRNAKSGSGSRGKSRSRSSNSGSDSSWSSTDKKKRRKRRSAHSSSGRKGRRDQRKKKGRSRSRRRKRSRSRARKPDGMANGQWPSHWGGWGMGSHGAWGMWGQGHMYAQTGSQANLALGSTAASPSSGVEALKQQITLMYTRFNPGKLPHLDTILEKYKGIEHKLLQALYTKYLPGAAEGEGQS